MSVAKDIVKLAVYFALAYVLGHATYLFFVALVSSALSTSFFEALWLLVFIVWFSFEKEVEEQKEEQKKKQQIFA
ncbi:MAG: hypothetical protein ACP5IG_04815 [Candidatus Micrarchaeia archaeon]